MRSLIISDFPRVIFGSILVLCQPGLTLKEVYPGFFFWPGDSAGYSWQGFVTQSLSGHTSFCREHGGEQFGLCKTHLTESSPFIAQHVRCKHWLWGGGCARGVQEPALRAGTCDDETHQLNEPLRLEALGAAGVFPVHFVSGLALYFQADANNWKNR